MQQDKIGLRTEDCAASGLTTIADRRLIEDGGRFDELQGGPESAIICNP